MFPDIFWNQSLIFGKVLTIDFKNDNEAEKRKVYFNKNKKFSVDYINVFQFPKYIFCHSFICPSKERGFSEELEAMLHSFECSSSTSVS